MKTSAPDDTVAGTPSLARTVDGILEHACRDEPIRKSELRCGDQVIVRTRNSVYWLVTLGDDTFAVTGGWFDRCVPTPATVAINGCTYGGSVIRTDIVAAKGLFLEFDNLVSTTRIQDVCVVSAGSVARA